MRDVRQGRVSTDRLCPHRPTRDLLQPSRGWSLQAPSPQKTKLDRQAGTYNVPSIPAVSPANIDTTLSSVFRSTRELFFVVLPSPSFVLQLTFRLLAPRTVERPSVFHNPTRHAERTSAPHLCAQCSWHARRCPATAVPLTTHPPTPPEVHTIAERRELATSHHPGRAHPTHTPLGKPRLRASRGGTPSAAAGARARGSAGAPSRALAFPPCLPVVSIHASTISNERPPSSVVASLSVADVLTRIRPKQMHARHHARARAPASLAGAAAALLI
jgi:hypothetical protein